MDSGASRTIVSAAVAARLGLRPRAHFAELDVAGTRRVGACAGPVRMSVGSAIWSVDCLGWFPDLRRLGGAEGCDGILGADALLSVDLLIEPRRKRMLVAPLGGLAGRFVGLSAPLELRAGRPGLVVELAERSYDGADEGARVHLVVDSGANRVVLFGRAAAAAGVRRNLPVVAVSAAFTAGQASMARLGPARIAGGYLTLGQVTLLPSVRDANEDGLLPLAYLGPTLFEPRRGRVTFGARERDGANRRDP